MLEVEELLLARRVVDGAELVLVEIGHRIFDRVRKLDGWVIVVPKVKLLLHGRLKHLILRLHVQRVELTVVEESGRVTRIVAHLRVRDRFQAGAQDGLVALWLRLLRLILRLHHHELMLMLLLLHQLRMLRLRLLLMRRILLLQQLLLVHLLLVHLLLIHHLLRQARRRDLVGFHEAAATVHVAEFVLHGARHLLAARVGLVTAY